MKIIFLDIDGVLNSEQFVSKCGDSWNGDQVDPVAVQRLNLLIKQSGAKVVLSSSWRLNETGIKSITEVQELLNSLGIECTVVGVTGELNNNREEEIDDWLSANSNIKNFVILDDDRLNPKRDSEDPFLNSHFVRTSWLDGLQDKHVEKAMIILNG